jgi:hypothetical protein
VADPVSRRHRFPSSARMAPVDETCMRSPSRRTRRDARRSARFAQTAAGPVVFTALPRLPALHIEWRRSSGRLRRAAGYLTFALGRAMGRGRKNWCSRATSVLASLFLRLPAGLAHRSSTRRTRSPPTPRPRCPSSCPARGPPASPSEIATARDARGASLARGQRLCHGSPRDWPRTGKRFRITERVAVIADGSRFTKDTEGHEGHARDAKDARPRKEPFTIGYGASVSVEGASSWRRRRFAALPDTRG